MSEIREKVDTLNNLFKEIQAYKAEHPEERPGFYFEHGSLLNAYREGDIGFEECVKRLKAIPVDLLLFCPACGTQHVDEAKPGVCEPSWLNNPHNSKNVVELTNDDKGTDSDQRRVSQQSSDGSLSMRMRETGLVAEGLTQQEVSNLPVSASSIHGGDKDLLQVQNRQAGQRIFQGQENEQSETEMQELSCSGDNRAQSSQQGTGPRKESREKQETSCPESIRLGASGVREDAGELWRPVRNLRREGDLSGQENAQFGSLPQNGEDSRSTMHSLQFDSRVRKGQSRDIGASGELSSEKELVHPPFKPTCDLPSHRCTACNHVWRPADVPTNGVKEIKTKGERDGDPTPRHIKATEQP